MPVIKSAKKKLRQDKKRQERNKVQKDFLKKVVKEFKKSPSDKGLTSVFKAADKSVKNHLIHKNKAARLKSTLAKTLSPNAERTASKAEKKPTKSAPKKTPTKKAAKPAKK